MQKAKDPYIKANFLEQPKIMGNPEKPTGFFSNLKLKDYSSLLTENKRFSCSNCSKLNKYYCLNCALSVGNYEFPQVDLSLRLVIVHHEKENPSKSSVFPLKFLVNASNFQIVTFKIKSEDENFETCSFDESSTVILYPHKSAVKCKELSSQELAKIRQVVAIDCTWNQSHSILNKL